MFGRGAATAAKDFDVLRGKLVSILGHPLRSHIVDHVAAAGVRQTGIQFCHHGAAMRVETELTSSERSGLTWRTPWVAALLISRT